MKKYKSYEIQQDSANKYRVIETDSTGTRRAIDFPPCESVAAAKRFINEIEEGETMKSAKTCKEWNEFKEKYPKAVKETDPHYEQFKEDVKNTTIALGKHFNCSPLL